MDQVIHISLYKCVSFLCCILWFIAACVFAGVFGWAYQGWEREKTGEGKCYIDENVFYVRDAGTIAGNMKEVNHLTNPLMLMRVLKVASSAYYNPDCSNILSDSDYDVIKGNVLKGERSREKISLSCSEEEKGGGTVLADCSIAEVETGFNLAKTKEGKFNIILAVSHAGYGGFGTEGNAEQMAFQRLNTKLTNKFGAEMGIWDYDTA